MLRRFCLHQVGETFDDWVAFLVSLIVVSPIVVSTRGTWPDPTMDNS